MLITGCQIEGLRTEQDSRAKGLATNEAGGGFNNLHTKNVPPIGHSYLPVLHKNQQDVINI